MSNVKIFSDAKSLAEAAGEEFLNRTTTVIEQKGMFTVALSGGTTPSLLYEFLVRSVQESPNYQDILQKIHFFWGDERDVPPEDSQSNFGNTNKDFFSKIKIPDNHIHRIKPEIRGASAAADDYEEELRHFFQLKKCEFPSFDLVFLGMGPDGHTASLFPKSNILEEKQRLVAAPFVEKFDAYRVTLTIPVINHAHCIIFLVTGKNKAKTLQKVFEGGYKSNGYPVQLINPQHDELLWFIDQAAAEYLSSDVRNTK